MLDYLFTRARALDALGRNEEAKGAYEEVLRASPQHFEALTSLGALLMAMGRRSEALDALTRAVDARPDEPRAHSNLAHLISDESTAKAREHYERALQLDPGHLNAHRGLAILLLRIGRTEAARRHGRIGFQGGAEARPYRGAGRPVSLLLVLSAMGNNVPIDQLLDDRVFLKWTLVAEFSDPNGELPPHDLVFNGIGDADRCAFALDVTASALSRAKAAILNPPSRVRETGRIANATRLGTIPGVVTAAIQEWSRDALAAPDAPTALVRQSFRWPVLLRSPGFHTGEHFVKVDDAAALQNAVAGLPGATLFVIQFLDTRGSDAMFRKYRAMIVDGQLFPLHVAISANWKVHYFSADMAQHPEHRAEDEAFLRDMPRVLGPRAVRALASVRDRLGLDYGGIDFAIDGQGNVVVFEANATMVIVQSPGDERWRYRIEPVEQVRMAVRRMLLKTAGKPEG
ncbi:MAG TPA: tetratricopeptide repeat protein [Polyangiaceae bacterium]